MTPRREFLLFSVVLAALVSGFLHESLLGGKILSPADVLFVQSSFAELGGPAYEPLNRLQIDPVLQFEPWLEFSRSMIRRGRLPLWNGLVGCGAPHLANGQSAVFDPFHAIAYLGTLPDAYAWMAAARLWMAGVGMFLLARRWGLQAWGRWFAGLTFPFCGFLVVWMLYPNMSAALWLPWLFWGTERLWERPGFARVSILALLVGMMLLSGQVQTSAHALITVGMYVAWRIHQDWKVDRNIAGRSLKWLASQLLGVALAAVAIVPLGEYLARSPVWQDRQADRPSAWRVVPPRWLDSACTATPYAFGSQRRGQPNLAKAVGVQNLNESAGGFAGLATLVVLAPLGIIAGWRTCRVRFLTGLLVVGFLGGFDFPPVANLLRILPIVNITDSRRLVLLVAFALVLLGGYGIDGAMELRRGRGWKWWGVTLVGGASGLVALAMMVGQFEGKLREKALAHYAHAAETTVGGDAGVFRAIAERQVSQTLRFVPRYGLWIAGELAICALVIGVTRSGSMGPRYARGTLLGLSLVDLFGFGFGLNPAIDRGLARPDSGVINYLRREVPPPARIVAIGSELPPNTLLRYDLADIRNYDSIETTRNLETFAALFEPGRSRTSRRSITWDGVGRARGILRLAGVRAVVGATEPPKELFDRVDTVDSLWIGRWDGPSWPNLGGNSDGRGTIALPKTHSNQIVVAETFDPGWRAWADGIPVARMQHASGFLALEVPPGARRVELSYEPIGVRVGGMISCAAVLLIGLLPAVERLTARREEKTRYRTWSARRARVRIRPTIRPVSSPASPNG